MGIGNIFGRTNELGPFIFPQSPLFVVFRFWVHSPPHLSFPYQPTLQTRDDTTSTYLSPGKEVSAFACPASEETAGKWRNYLYIVSSLIIYVGQMPFRWWNSYFVESNKSTWLKNYLFRGNILIFRSFPVMYSNLWPSSGCRSAFWFPVSIISLGCRKCLIGGSMSWSIGDRSWSPTKRERLRSSWLCRCRCVALCVVTTSVSIRRTKATKWDSNKVGNANPTFGYYYLTCSPAAESASTSACACSLRPLRSRFSI